MASSHAPLALAALATAGVLLSAVWAERRRRAELAALQAQLSGWRGQLEALKEQVDAQCKQIAAVWKSQTITFTVCQYNILASYLGDNKQPWFLYNCPDLTEDLRRRVTEKFYERGPDGKFCNLGWPKYAVGLLTEEQQHAIEEEHERHFAWHNRRDRLLKTVQETNSDLLSLVELDRYEEFWKPEMAKLGFESAYRKRPRKASADGCGIFWRRHLFELIDQDHLEFVDRADPETGRTSKDRCALFVLLRHLHSSERMIFISTHLARNPEDCAQTKMRAKQAAALFQKLTPFAAHHDALDAPVILAGDLNTTNIRQLGNIARAVLELCDQPVHPFVFSAMATRSLPTSVTSTRRMRIDYLLHSTAVQMIDAPNMPALASPIPDDEHPSDHIPLVIKVRLRSGPSRWCAPSLTPAAPSQWCAPTPHPPHPSHPSSPAGAHQERALAAPRDGARVGADGARRRLLLGRRLRGPGGAALVRGARQGIRLLRRRRRRPRHHRGRARRGDARALLRAAHAAAADGAAPRAPL